ncbi:sensor histidine kinase [Maribacter sp. MAR_2009_72]|uniref:sensor histidine kinase n=1 Tax=Maribacter sp. MAR_2009_72 TaxID=1250050 RepID=UPI001199FD2B|nr:histidine kinase [Maribacter sp. MAR_2009_72]TVZ14794.1 histidine kinase [Maribacter sp. MAR_2009_72]
MAAKKKINDIIESKGSESYKIHYKYHIIFWSIYILFNTLRWGSLHNDYVYSIKTNLIGFPIHMALAYFNVYFLMPVFVFNKRYLEYTLAILGSLALMLVVKFNLTYYLIDTNVMPEASEVVNSITLNYAIVTMFGELYVVSFVTAIKITIDWLREHQKLHELETRQLTSELSFLRSQVSPHFFFNTLNNIYSLTLEKSNRAPEVVLKLSELMRYLLYAARKNKQDLQSEIELIQNYLDLEKIRFNDSLTINMNITGNLDNKRIAPMLLIPFVENSFKHGANKTIEPMTIDINIAVKEKKLYFEIANPIPETLVMNRLAEEEGGIGLSNVKKRLELGYRPDEYELNITTTNNIFKVFLKLNV